MATVIDEIGTRLATAISGTLGTNVFQGMMPPTPDVCAAVYETGGLSGIEVLGTAGRIRTPVSNTVLFVIRSFPSFFLLVLPLAVSSSSSSFLLTPLVLLLPWYIGRPRKPVSSAASA